MKRITLLLAILATTLSLSARDANDIRLLYWNIQNGMWSDQPDNYDNFIKFVQEQDPDICVWCEAASIYYSNTADHFKTKDEAYLPANWDTLAERYGHKYVYLGGWRDNYPQVITSKFPIRNVKRILGDPKDVIVAHGAGWAQIEVQGKTLNLVTLHTWPHGFAYLAEDRAASAAENGGDKYRAREMKFICDETINSVPEAKNQFWMMMGDFNSVSRVDSPAYDIPKESTKWLVHDYIKKNTPYTDIIAKWYDGEHFSSTGGTARIDFVYATPLMYSCIRYTKIFKSEDWLTVVRDPQKLSNFYHPSDHLPILVDFNLTGYPSEQSLNFEWKDLEKGAQYAQFQGELFGSQQCISVFRYPERKFTTDLVNDSGLLQARKPGDPTAVNPAAPATTTSGFGERYGAIASMNGSYFNMRTLFPATFVRDNGEVEGQTADNETFRVDGALCVKGGKKVEVVPAKPDEYEANLNGYPDVMTSGPVLIKKGIPQVGWPDDSFFLGRHPRTAVGIGNGYTYLIVMDGRFHGQSEGMTIPEVTEVCRQLGCSDAINLDGGGSSALWIKGLGVISHPYDNHRWDGAGERVVPNAVIVK